MILWKISLRTKRRRRNSISTTFLKKIQDRNQSVMGPLSKIWTAVESGRLSQEDSVEVDLKEIEEFVEQTVLLLGQASNSISYYRRFYMLLALKNSLRKVNKCWGKTQSLTPEKWQKFIWEKVPWKHLAHLQIKKANLRDVIEYIGNKIETLSSRPSPDTKMEFRRAKITKASSQKRSDVTVFEKAIQ